MDAKFEFYGGVGDNLFVFEDRIVIQHKGILNVLTMGIHGDKTIYFYDITSIQFRKATKLSNGHIQFSLKGGKESVGGIIAAAGDENTITFSGKKDNNDVAQEIVDYLHEQLRTVKSGKNTAVQAISSAEELKKFKELLDNGIITQEEFDAKKKQLLGL